MLALFFSVMVPFIKVDYVQSAAAAAACVCVCVNEDKCSCVKCEHKHSNCYRCTLLCV